jgi:hypothetical protein
MELLDEQSISEIFADEPTGSDGQAEPSPAAADSDDVAATDSNEVREPHA